MRPSFEPHTSIPPLPTNSGARRWIETWSADLRTTLKRDFLVDDFVAAMTVAAIAVPLSMAIALASDVDAQRGLVSAVIGGAVAAAVGSSRLSVTGPAAAMAVLVGQVVDAHGIAGLAIVTVLSGIFQVAVGLAGLGILTQLVPKNVVHGFTAGIGVVILVGQLPRALGLPAPDESHALDVLSHVGSLLHDANPRAVAISGFVATSMLLGPRFAPKVPFALVGVLVCTVAAWAMALDVPRVGALPPLTLSFPPLNGDIKWSVLVADAAAVFALGSLESLLSVQALEQLRPEERHDPNHELVGQGVANVSSGLLGGIPVTSVIARSALNATTGARTRRAAFLQAVVVAIAIVVARDALGAIPVAALGGVLIATGIRMLDIPWFLDLLENAKAEAGIFAITAVVMVGSDLVVGVQMGLIAACVVALFRLTRVSVRLVPAHRDEPHHVLFGGSLTFLGAPRLDQLTQRLRDVDTEPGCIFDLRHLDAIDPTGVERLVQAARALTDRGANLVILGANSDVASELAAHLPPAVRTAHTDGDAYDALGRGKGPSGQKKMLAGLSRFQRVVRPRLEPLLQRLAEGQSPHTMMLTCADSRVVPTLLTGAGPGELFVVRNIGALIPPHGSDTLNDEGAALEYAIRVLGVRNLVICAHSKCGAMTALCTGEIPADLHALVHWSDGARAIAGVQLGEADIAAATRAAARRQLDHLASYPVVAAHLATGDIELEAWYYDIEHARVERCSHGSDTWESIGD